jgi:hypothetical protein
MIREQTNNEMDVGFVKEVSLSNKLGYGFTIRLGRDVRHDAKGRNVTV